MEEELKLMLGIVELTNTYKKLKDLNFSGCVLTDVEDMIDDLMGLVENKEIKNFLLKDIDYDYEKDKFYVIERG